jgi:serine/threonine protein kinase
VYSFGIVLLEMLTGRRPTDPMFCDGLSIVNFVRSNFPDQILGTLDAFLVEEYQECSRANLEEENEIHQCLLSLVKVALSCASQSPSERRNMREAATELNAIYMSYMS